MSITYSECLFVALVIQHAMRLRHIVICDPPRSTIFFHIISQTVPFSGGGGKVLKTKCLFWFSLQLLSGTFLILRRNKRDMIKQMWIGCHVEYPLFLSNLNNIWIFLTDFRKILKYQILWKPVQWEQSCSMWTDGQTNMTKLTVAFRNFANAPKN